MLESTGFTSGETISMSVNEMSGMATAPRQTRIVPSSGRRLWLTTTKSVAGSDVGIVPTAPSAITNASLALGEPPSTWISRLYGRKPSPTAPTAGAGMTMTVSLPRPVCTVRISMSAASVTVFKIVPAGFSTVTVRAGESTITTSWLAEACTIR
ncbi:MAG TPA: hypothetical protein VMY42_22295 [Thermoguttaceae bacterium]|nr:hypothetical protein [Thermoguttaceae bacterium]